MLLQDYQFSILILAVVANLSLAFFVIRNRSKDVGSRFFAILAITFATWEVVNYFSLNSDSVYTIYWIRLVMFFAVPQTVLFFLFVHTFPSIKLRLTKFWLTVTIVLLSLAMISALSPYLFSYIEWRPNPIPIPGPLMPFYIMVAIGYLLAGIYLIFKKYRKATDIEKAQWKFIILGLLITLGLVIFFKFVMVVAFESTLFVPVSPLFTLPLVIFMTYAIFKHHLLNIKVLTAELLTISLVSFLFIQTLAFKSLSEFFINILFTLLVAVFGVFLVRSVLNEVYRRQQLQRLAKQLERANDKLKELDNAKTEFLSITSHQLRTPLSGIKGYMSMVLDGDFGKFSDEQNKILTRVYKEVERLIRLVQVFLNVSRIESGRLVIDKIKGNLCELLLTSIKELTPAAKDKGLKLEYEPPKQPIEIYADFDKLKDVVVNLIDNAIKYTKQGKVWVRCELRDWYVHVEVHDTGVGIDPKEAAGLFVKFTRAKGIAQVNASGTGLGLFIAKKIIMGHGGKIWAESKGKGKGSMFVFEIPVE